MLKRIKQTRALPFSITLNGFTFTPKLIPTIVTAILLPILVSLGIWQLHRAQFKESLLQMYQQQTVQAPLNASAINAKGDWFHYRMIEMTGVFDNNHQFLLDNKTFQGKVGYHVVTPFRPKGGKGVILVDRGWIPQGISRRVLPEILPVTGQITIEGYLVPLPTKHFTLGKPSANGEWPMRIQSLRHSWLNKHTGYPLVANMVLLAEDSPYGFKRKWDPVSVNPAKHIGYAVQWFALAFTLLIIFIVVNTKRKEHNRDDSDKISTSLS